MNRIQKNFPRRKFLRLLSSVVGLATFDSLFRTVQAFGEPPSSAGSTTMRLVSAHDEVAKALNFVHDQKDVPKKMRTQRDDTDFAQQFCRTCARFSGPDGKIKNVEVGRCEVITSGKVEVRGWCTSWNKKQ